MKREGNGWGKERKVGGGRGREGEGSWNRAADGLIKAGPALIAVFERGLPFEHRMIP